MYCFALNIFLGTLTACLDLVHCCHWLADRKNVSWLSAWTTQACVAPSIAGTDSLIFFHRVFCIVSCPQRVLGEYFCQPTLNQFQALSSCANAQYVLGTAVVTESIFVSKRASCSVRWLPGCLVGLLFSPNTAMAPGGQRRLHPCPYSE